MKRIPKAIKPPNALDIAAATSLFTLEVSPRPNERTLGDCRLLLSKATLTEQIANPQPDLIALIPIREHQSKAREQEAFKHAQEHATRGQLAKVGHEAVAQTHDAPAEGGGGDDAVEAEALHDQRGRELSQDVQRVEEGDGGVELGPLEAQVADHALRRREPDVAPVQE